jgi:hypothetical protein
MSTQDENSSRREEIKDAILRYLKDHPCAMDTIEGIADWWLSDRRIARDMELLASVLTELTAAGVLTEDTTGSSRRYSLKML